MKSAKQATNAELIQYLLNGNEVTQEAGRRFAEVKNALHLCVTLIENSAKTGTAIAPNRLELQIARDAMK